MCNADTIPSNKHLMWSPFESPEEEKLYPNTEVSITKTFRLLPYSILIQEIQSKNHIRILAGGSIYTGKLVSLISLPLSFHFKSLYSSSVSQPPLIL